MVARLFTSKAIKRQTEKQDHICLYCMLPFGTLVSYRGGNIQMPVGDHFVPWTYDPRTDLHNLIVSCQVCNSFKADKVFQNLEQARRVILVSRMNKGIQTYWIPVTPITLDPAKWSSDYGQYLTEP